MQLGQGGLEGEAALVLLEQAKLKQAAQRA
jgi:hypothetical protein